MAKLEKVIITKEIVRPYGGVAEPEVGMTGHIVHDDDTPEKNTCIRFLAETLGYSYDPEYDDKDRKYVRVYVPNDNFEIVAHKSKNTANTSVKKENNSVEKVVSKVKGNKMKQPEIMIKLGNNWQVLPGHCCDNQKEMENYVKTLDPNGSRLKVMDLAEIEQETKLKRKM
jgi:hypothetical protein